MRVTFSRFAVSTLVATSLALSMPVPFAAELAPDAPETYVVRSGDTLWDIAGRFLNDPWNWSQVWQANSGVGDPNLIYPGDVLQLTMVDGRPRVGVSRSGRPGGSHGGMRVVKLTPQVKSSSLAESVPTIQISDVSPFLTQPYVADSDDLKRASYVVGFPDEHIVAGVHDSIYVRRITSNSQANFQILRPGNELRDPDSNELLGYEAAFIANARLERTGDPAKLQVTRMEREVSIGDRVVPGTSERPLENFFPHPAPDGTRGRILSVLNGVSQIGPNDVVVINRGARDRMEVGHVFEVFVGGTKERDQVRGGSFDPNWRHESPLSTEFWFGRDYERKGWRGNEPEGLESFPLHASFRRQNAQYFKPFEQSGLLMIFRTFDRVSFALVLKANRFINVGDWIAPPTS